MPLAITKARNKMTEIVVSAQLVWGVMSVVFGLLVLAAPKILNYLVALYLIITGIVMMLPSFGVV